MFSISVYNACPEVVKINLLTAVDPRQLSCTVLLEPARYAIISKKKNANQYKDCKSKFI